MHWQNVVHTLCGVRFLSEVARYHGEYGINTINFEIVFS